ncbi:hypothetical protein HMPREF0591_3262 [Mycobacterium parascrofulaceum ATCC BAA-614]|uniref:Uncharacterized protein n=1 Tax=Mycobacterium parascrofulaceum ATCC BAA-614 TaxID=525368 RepID=D5PAR8_9MYCO|nr:hypothetical protein HMPREF0591_3262 [Mycobacterium parascrofulaceum ATCC BAA-614]
MSKIPPGNRFTTTGRRLGNNAVGAAQEPESTHHPQPAAVFSPARVTRHRGVEKSSS